MKIGLIGTGLLGNAVGLHLLNSGYCLTTFNRTKEKTHELEKNGAKTVHSPKEVALNSDIVLTVVKDSKAVKQVSFDKEGIIYGNHEGLIVCDMSTINPLDSKKISQKFLESKISMLDTPVMGGPKAAVTGDLVMMVAGDQNSYVKCKPLFEEIANKVFFLGGNGSAHTVKLAMNLQITLLALAISEGITFAKGANIDPKIFLKILNSTYFKTGMSENKAHKMIEDDFEATFTLENLKKDIETILSTANSLGLKLPMIEKAGEIYKNAEIEGFGQLDYTGILAYIKKINQER